MSNSTLHETTQARCALAADELLAALSEQVASGPPGGLHFSIDDLLRVDERQVVNFTLVRAGDISKAARRLGVPRTTLQSRITKIRRSAP
jgi:DNA-binding NtrC family response regulator